MRKMPRGSSSITHPSSSGVLSSTWKPLASSPFAVRRRISESSLSRPGECASSRKMPQQYGSLTLSLLSGADKGPSASLPRRWPLLAALLVLDSACVELACPSASALSLQSRHAAGGERFGERYVLR